MGVGVASMYSLCPCTCSESDGAELEEAVLLCLPRNLSYVGESYLDRYSVSAAFVHNSGLEKQLLQADTQQRYGSAAHCAAYHPLGQQPDTGCSSTQETGGWHTLGSGDSHTQCIGDWHTQHICGTCGQHTVDTGQQHTGVRGQQYTGQHSSVIGQRTGVIGQTGGQFSGGPDWGCALCAAMADQGRCQSALSSGVLTTSDSGDINVGSTMAASIPPPNGTAPSSGSTSTPVLTPLLVSIECGKRPAAQSDFDRYVVKTESPDSDLVSEEGIFVNMMDDLDTPGATGGKSTTSEASDDTYVSGDSMYYSPLEGEDGERQTASDFKLCLEEAVQQAAEQLHPSDPPATEAANEQSPHDGPTLTTDSQFQDSSQASAPQKDSAGRQLVAGSESADKTDSTSGSVDSDLSKVASGLQITVNDRPFQYDARGQLTSSYRDLVSPESPVYKDSEFNFTRTELRKSASLKSSKTPPGTPRRKKVVRFADAMGLDLESVRHVLNLDVPPKIPASAMKDLQTGLSEDRKEIGTKYIVETFQQPGANINFRDRVLCNKVALENALVVAGSITGVVRVANIGFHKVVRVRFTTNNWATFHDIAASYMQNSNDGGTDRFSFTLVPPADFAPGSKLEFAVSFSISGVEYWDNNSGTNYIFECFAKTVPTESENAWMHFL